MASIVAESQTKIFLVIFFSLLELLDMTASAKKEKFLPNVNCQTQETVIAVDPSDHGYYPYYVKLHRCAGSASTVSPKVQHCVAQSYDEINIQVYSHFANIHQTTVTVRNHTSCAPECVASPEDCDFTVRDWDEDLCACKCRYPDGPPKELACKERFRWNSHKCACECDRAPALCPIRMSWSKDICACKCDDSIINDCTQMKMGIDVDCQCVNVQAFLNPKEVHSRNRMFITLLIGQAVIIILLICALVHWIRKRNQRSSAHAPLDRLDSSKTNDDVAPPYLEVAVDSVSTDSLDGAKDSSDDDSCTAPLSSKLRVTDI